jgi:hypothetical protein
MALRIEESMVHSMLTELRLVNLSLRVQSLIPFKAILILRLKFKEKRVKAVAAEEVKKMKTDKEEEADNPVEEPKVRVRKKKRIRKISVEAKAGDEEGRALVVEVRMISDKREVVEVVIKRMRWSTEMAPKI